MKFDTSLAVFQHLISIDEDNMEANVLTFIEKEHEFYADVSELIAAHRENKKQTSFNELISVQAENLIEDNIIHDLVNTQVGVYKLTQKLGQGGMGAVYLGERNDGQLEQKVAIKFVYPSIVAIAGENFLHKEAQYLANLEHTNIAKIFTVDKTENKLPYMVMEYVDGVPIDDYCESHNLNLNERLKLFKKVCSAVQTAHQNMVIHADIKPSNILVDKQGEPKLMDFGIAQNINQAIEESTFSKNQKQSYLKALSRDYASPEQVNGENLTSVCDVYSLGKLLIKICTCVNKQNGPKEIYALARRACDKVPSLRFNSPAELSSEINNYCKGFPISEYSVAISYRVTKYIRRNILSFSLSTALLISLTAGAATLYLQNSKLREQIVISNEVSTFLSNLFNASNSLYEVTPKVKDLLDEGVNRISKELHTSNSVRAKLLKSMAKSYFGLREFDASEKLYLESIKLFELIADTDELLESYNLIADLYIDMSKYKQAEEYLKKVLNYQNKSKEITYFNWSRYGQLYHEQGDYDRALKYYNKSLVGYQTLPEPNLIGIADITNNIGLTYKRLGDYDKSVAHLNTALAKSKEVHGDISHPRIAGVLLNLGSVLGQQKKYDEAILNLLSTLTMYKELNPEGHPGESILYNNLGAIYYQWGKQEKAQHYYALSLEISIEKLGKEHIKVAILYHNIANSKRQTGHLEKAIASHQEAINILNKIDISGPTLALFKGGYAETLFEYKQYREAKMEVEFAINTLKESLPNHPKLDYLEKVRLDILRHL